MLKTHELKLVQKLQVRVLPRLRSPPRTPVARSAPLFLTPPRPTPPQPAPPLSPGGVEALSSQALSLCTHALALEPMFAPAEEEALFRVLAALAAFLDLGASALSLAKSLGIGEQLSALPLPETAAAKVKDSRAQLVAKLA